MPKKRLQIQRSAKHIALPKQEDLQLFYFKVVIDRDDVKSVEQIPDFPFEHTDDNGSILAFTGAGFGIHVTWLPFKPEPRSELRYKGYLAIQSDIARRKPGLAADLAKLDIGFGHADDATIKWHPVKGDDA